MECNSAILIEDERGTDPFPSEPMNDRARPLAVVIVSSDPVVRKGMAEILQDCCLKPILAAGLFELKLMSEGETVVACLCGFRVANGTIREISAYLKSQPVEIPMIMVSAPMPICEYGDFLDSLSVGAFNFICHPYRTEEIQLIVWSAIQSYCETAHFQMHGIRQLDDSVEVPDLREFWLRSSI